MFYGSILTDIGASGNVSNASHLVCVFQEDVESFMKQPGNEKAEAVITRLHEQHQKYKFMELNLSQKKLR